MLLTKFCFEWFLDNSSFTLFRVDHWNRLRVLHLQTQQVVDRDLLSY